MRLGLVPRNVREWLLLHSARFPLPVFDVMGTMLLSRAVMAGVHFGVFDRVSDDSRSAADLAAEIGCDPHGLALLLDALVTCGYLEKKVGRYSTTALSRRWLLSGRPQTLTHFIRYNYDLWDLTSQLEEFIQRGAARNIHQEMDEPRWRNYLLGLRDLAALAADEMIAKLRFSPPPRSLLDVGAGHCYYALAMCRRYPSLRVTVVDLEPATRIGRELVSQAGLGGRFEFRPSSLTEASLGENHDVAFLFNVVHHLDEEANRRALERLHAALAPRGRLVVWDSFREEGEKQQKDQLGSLLALFFGLISQQQAYAFSRVAAWARQAGFSRIRQRKLRSAPFASLLVATK